MAAGKTHTGTDLHSTRGPWTWHIPRRDYGSAPRPFVFCSWRRSVAAGTWTLYLHTDGSRHQEHKSLPRKGGSETRHASRRSRTSADECATGTGPRNCRPAPRASTQYSLASVSSIRRSFPAVVHNILSRGISLWCRGSLVQHRLTEVTMAGQVDSALSELLSQYLANWGPVSWRQELADARFTDDPDLGRAILSLSAIETDSRVIYRKLHIAKLDRRQVIHEFNISWLAEEAEHGRALKCLAAKLGVHETPPDRSARTSIRSTVSWPSLAVARVLGSALEATYLTLGATQEFVALTTY